MNKVKIGKKENQWRDGNCEKMVGLIRKLKEMNKGLEYSDGLNNYEKE